MFQCVVGVWLVKYISGSGSVLWKMLGLSAGGRVVSGGW